MPLCLIKVTIFALCVAAFAGIAFCISVYDNQFYRYRQGYYTIFNQHQTIGNRHVENDMWELTITFVSKTNSMNVM